MLLYGGITGVVSEKKDRDSIWEAMQARRTFGTSGPKIRVLFRASAGSRLAWQGEKVDPGTDDTWTLTTTARTDMDPISGDFEYLDRVEIWRDGEAGIPLCAIDLEGVDEGEGTCTLDLTGVDRAFVLAAAFRVDDERAWSSPIFFERE